MPHAIRIRANGGPEVLTFEDVSVGGRSRYDLDTLTRTRRQPGWIAGDHPDLFIAADDPLQDLRADLAGGSGDDKHGHLISSE